MTTMLMRTELVRLLSFTLIPMALFGLLVLTVVGHQVSAKTEAEDRAHMEHVQVQMETAVRALDSLNLTFCVNSEITSTFARAFVFQDTQARTQLMSICKHYLIPAAAAYDNIHSIYVYTPNMQEMFLSSTVGPLEIARSQDAEWLTTYEWMRQEDKVYYAQSRSFKNFAFEQREQRILTLYRRLFLGEGVIVLNLYQDDFDAILKGESASDGQVMLVVNEENEILMSGRRDMTFVPKTLELLSTVDEEKLQSFVMDDQAYFVTRLSSDSRYQWTYLSLTPLRELHAFSYSIFSLLLVTLVPLFAMCVVFAYRHAKRLQANALRIANTLEGAERYEMDSDGPEEPGDDFYGMVTQRIVRNYTERNRMRHQLEQKQHEMHEMELNALNSQINPHFLFNTLKSAYWMSFSLTKGPNEVSRMIESMTEILEYSLDSNDDLATLGDEIRNTQAYIDIQHMRYQDRFDVTWDYDPELEKYYTVKLLLQPLVENAIMHGMSWTDKDTLHIHISIVKKDEMIHITLRDDGCGIDAKRFETITSRLQAHSTEGHIGLYSCNKRLCLTFGEEYGIRISNSNGVMIAMHFPCLTE